MLEPIGCLGLKVDNSSTHLSYRAPLFDDRAVFEPSRFTITHSYVTRKGKCRAIGKIWLSIARKSRTVMSVGLNVGAFLFANAFANLSAASLRVLP